MKVILNANSRLGRKDTILKKDPLIDLIVTETLEDLDCAVKDIKGETIGIAGGDGSFLHFYNRYEGDAKILVLPYGSGRGISYYTGFRDIKDTLDSFFRGDYRVEKLPILSIEYSDGRKEYGHLFSFGDDAEVLHRCLSRGRKDLGMFVIQTLRQFGKMLAYNFNGKRPVCTVKTPSKYFEEAPCNTVAVGTIPYFGYGFKALPLAGQGKTHVRIFNMGVARFLLHGKRIWNGKFVNLDEDYPYMQDLVSDEVEITMKNPQYCNNSGEPRFKQKSVKIKVERHVNLICKTTKT